MLLDQGRALGWDAPWFNEQAINTELWSPRRPHSPHFLVRARRPSSAGGGSSPGAGACYGTAADRQRDRANEGQ